MGEQKCNPTFVKNNQMEEEMMLSWYYDQMYRQEDDELADELEEYTLDEELSKRL